MLTVVEGPELADLLATHPVVLGVHPLISEPNRRGVLNTERVWKAFVVTELGQTTTLAIALDIRGSAMPSGFKRKDTRATDWLVCLPPIESPEIGPSLLRFETKVRLPDLPPRDGEVPRRARAPSPKPLGIQDLMVLSILGRSPTTDPGDYPALAGLAP